MGKPELNVLHCTHCGERHVLRRADDEIPPCVSCGRKLVRTRALLTALVLSDDACSHCETCDCVNLELHLFCFACGEQLASDEEVERDRVERRQAKPAAKARKAPAKARARPARRTVRAPAAKAKKGTRRR
jgi:hypothetical protein